MVTVKFTSEQYEELVKILEQNANGKGLSSFVNETYYGHSKRAIAEKLVFNVQSFELYAEDKRIERHNKAFLTIRDDMTKAVRVGLDCSHTLFSNKDKQAYFDAYESIIAGGMTEDKVIIRQLSWFDRFKLKTDKENAIFIKF